MPVSADRTEPLTADSHTLYAYEFPRAHRMIEVAQKGDGEVGIGDETARVGGDAGLRPDMAVGSWWGLRALHRWGVSGGGASVAG